MLRASLNSVRTEFAQPVAPSRLLKISAMEPLWLRRAGSRSWLGEGLERGNAEALGALRNRCAVITKSDNGPGIRDAAPAGLRQADVGPGMRRRSRVRLYAAV